MAELRPGWSRVIRCSCWLWKQVEYCNSQVFPRSLFWSWRSARRFSASSVHTRLIFFFENCFVSEAIHGDPYRVSTCTCYLVHWSARYCKTISNSWPFPPDLSESSVCTILQALCKCLQSKVQRMFWVTTHETSPAEAWQSLTTLTPRAKMGMRPTCLPRLHRRWSWLAWLAAAPRPKKWWGGWPHTKCLLTWVRKADMETKQFNVSFGRRSLAENWKNEFRRWVYK